VPLPRHALVLSIAATCLAAVASLSVLLWPGSFPPPGPGPNDVLAEARGWSAVTLVIAVPALAIASSRTSSPAWRLVWFGVLAYFFYTYLEMAVSPPFTALHLVYVAAFACALWALIGGAGAIGTEEYEATLESNLLRRTIGIFLLLFGLGLAAVWLRTIIGQTVEGRFGWPSGADAVRHVVRALDLGLLVPLGLAGGVLLIRRRPSGVVLGGVGLIVASLMSFALSAMVAVQTFTAGSSLRAAAPFFAVALVACGMLGAYLDALGPRERNASLAGRTFVVTGPTSGIGREIAAQLAARGASLVLVCRDENRAAATRAEIAQMTTGHVDAVVGDLSKQSEVRRVAREVLAIAPRITALVNNAGVSPYTRRLTEDGIELGTAVNVLVPFLLMQLLADRLRQSAPARIVNVAGMSHKGARLDFGDMTFARRFDPLAAGKRSKLLLVMLTLEAARRLADTGVTCNCVHPGIARTGIQRELPWYDQLAIRTVMRPWFGSPRRPASNVVHLATAAELEGVTGRYFHKRSIDRPSPLALDRALVEQAWAWCEAATRANPPPEAGASSMTPTVLPNSFAL
jgi:retinol dehydrogenase 14